jgi:hypothetical protein
MAMAREYDSIWAAAMTAFEALKLDLKTSNPGTFPLTLRATVRSVQ